MVRVFDAIVLLLYPAIVLLGLTFLSVRYTALLLLVLLGRRFIGAIITNKGASLIVILQAVAMAGIIGAAAISDSALVLWFTPFAISLTFLAQFAVSFRTVPIIERFARLRRPDLPPDHVRYCRRLTKIWLAVLVGNSLLVLGATFSPDQLTWAILVGPVSYFYLGTFIAGEYVFRKWRFQEFDSKNPLDRALRPIFERRNAG